MSMRRVVCGRGKKDLTFEPTSCYRNLFWYRETPPGLRWEQGIETALMQVTFWCPLCIRLRFEFLWVLVNQLNYFFWLTFWHSAKKQTKAHGNALMKYLSIWSAWEREFNQDEQQLLSYMMWTMYTAGRLSVCRKLLSEAVGNSCQLARLKRVLASLVSSCRWQYSWAWHILNSRGMHYLLKGLLSNGKR